MSLSPELQELHDAESLYIGDPQLVGEKIKNVRLHGVVGATTSGKTTLITRAVDLMPDSNAVPSAVDRFRKPGDPDNYETASEDITTDKLIHDIRAGLLVNYAIFPTGNIYATYSDYYSATHNFLPTMSSSIAQLSQAAFASFDQTYIYLPAEQWAELIKAKNFNGKRKERMKDAIESFDYALEHPDNLVFIRNQYGREGLERAARELMFVANGTSQGDNKEKAIEDIKKLKAIAYELAA